MKSKSPSGYHVTGYNLSKMIFQEKKYYLLENELGKIDEYVEQVYIMLDWAAFLEIIYSRIFFKRIVCNLLFVRKQIILSKRLQFSIGRGKMEAV